MRSKRFSTTSNQKPCTPWAIEKALLKKTENLFLINSAMDNHTAHSTGIAKFKRVFFELVAKEFRFTSSHGQCEVSTNSIFLNHVLVVMDPHNNLSPGCLVKSGYEIKLSKNNSYISKNGEEVLSVSFRESNWVVYVGSSQPKGFVEDVKPKSTKRIIRTLGKELTEALDKASLKKPGSRRGALIYGIEWQREKNIRYYKKTRIKNHLQQNAGNVSWVLNSCCSFHSINTKQNLINIRSWEGKGESGYSQWVGDYLCGNLLLKDVRYSPDYHYNSLSLNKLAEEGFETYLTNQNATIIKDDDVFLTAPMVGKLWIANSLHEKKGWLENGCPYETHDRIDFETKYGNKFTKEEIKQAFAELSHECELEGPRDKLSHECELEGPREISRPKL